MLVVFERKPRRRAIHDKAGAEPPVCGVRPQGLFPQMAALQERVACLLAILDALEEPPTRRVGLFTDKI